MALFMASSAAAMWLRGAEDSVERDWEYYLPDFAYVVRAQEQARVAFGSAQSRAVLPLAGAKGGASRLALLAARATDALDHIGPGTYSLAAGALHKVPSKESSEAGGKGKPRVPPRFKEVDLHLPAPNAYQLDPGRPCAPSKAPFNTTTTRRALVTSNTPGPGSYTPGALSNRPGVAVAVRCGQGDGPGRCEACQEELTPSVEFWSLDGHAVQGLRRDALLCQACMASARAQQRGARTAARYTRWQLDAFKKTRDCSDIHRHEGTRSKISLVDPKTVAKLRRKEAYLAKYFLDRPAVQPDPAASTEPAKLTDAEVVAARPRRLDPFCCLHEALNSFNRDNMSFGLQSSAIYDTWRRCALDFHPSRASSMRSSSVRDSSVRDSSMRNSSMRNSSIRDSVREAVRESLKGSVGSRPSIARTS